MIITVTCPYCGTERKQQIDPSNAWQNLVLTCDIEAGGCDQPYFVHVEIKADVEVKAIEGYMRQEIKAAWEQDELKMYEEAETFYYPPGDDWLDEPWD